MDTTTMIKCHCCEDQYEQDEIYNYDKDDNPICETCEDSYWSDAITVMRFFQGETSKQYYSTGLDRTMDAEDGEQEDGTPDCLEDASWVSIGHRGSFNIEPSKGYKTILTGWATGRFEDVKYKHAFNDFTDELSEGDLFPPCPVYIVTSHTGNVFSTGIDVIIPKNSEDAFMEWLEEETVYSFDQLNFALS